MLLWLKFTLIVTSVYFFQPGRFHAFEKAHWMDPPSSGRGVRQFKTYLLHKLEKVDLIVVAGLYNC